MTKYVGKKVKVYISTEKNEVEKGECQYAYGRVMFYRMESVNMSTGPFDVMHVTLQPLKKEPNEIDLYLDSKKVTWYNDPKIITESRKSPVIHPAKEVIKPKKYNLTGKYSKKNNTK